MTADLSERVAEIKRLRQIGLSTQEIGTRLGITKNAVIGLIHRHAPELSGPSRGWAGQQPVTTMLERLDAINAKFDKLMEECRGIPTVKPNAAVLRLIDAAAARGMRR